ncbi:universal stress protein [Streptomyces cinereoruber subsp. cinereoruber]|nr:universal stress protein [Streptomyces cinereoruber]
MHGGPAPRRLPERERRHLVAGPPQIEAGHDGPVRNAGAARPHQDDGHLDPARDRHADRSDEGLAGRRRLLAESVAGRAGRHPEVEVVEEVVGGHPVEQLALASRSALALVVGRRGRGGYPGMRLGSTLHGLLRHAECPVVTVPGPPVDRSRTAGG